MPVRLTRRSPQELTVVGGSLPQVELEPLLGAMPTGLCWSICEYADRYRLIEGRPTDLVNLERLRWFGESGDFEARLDGGRYHWRFIGLRLSPLLNEFCPLEFWACHPEIPHLVESEILLYLWGERRQSDQRFCEQRLARAVLDYPVDSLAGRATIRAKLYTYLGRQQFVWYTGLEGR